MTSSFRQRIPAPATLAIATLAIAVACAAPRPAVAQATAPVLPTPHGDTSAAAQARADSMRYAYTAADIRFMTAMMGHHAQAITMSRMAPTHGASPAVRRLASRIINAQQDEIATMARWLGDRHQPVPDVAAAERQMARMRTSGARTPETTMPGMEMSDAHAPDAGMSGMGMSGMLMPGMLTAAQMAQLDRARGPEFDRLFLTFMIQHHRGAVGMVDALFGTYGAGQDETVFKFASDVHVDQTTEIARMQQMLVALLSDP